MSTPLSFVWKPANVRLVVIDGFVPSPRGMSLLPPIFLNWSSKDPKDVLDYQLDIRPALVGNEGDKMEYIDLDIFPNQPGDLSADNTLADGSKLIIWFSGGRAGTTYNITVKISLTSGRIIQRTILLPVIALSNMSVPKNSIETTAQQPLTDQDGNYILY